MYGSQGHECFGKSAIMGVCVCVHSDSVLSPSALRGGGAGFTWLCLHTQAGPTVTKALERSSEGQAGW